MVQYGQFRVGDLFDVRQGRRLKKSDQIKGKIPYIMASGYNNGVTNYIDNPISINNNCLTGDILGNIFYQDYKFGYSDDTCIMKLKNNHSRNVYLYIATVIKYSLIGISYSNKIRHNRYRNMNITLPIDSTDQPDWDYMEEYIQTIKDKLLDLVKDKANQEINAGCRILNITREEFDNTLSSNNTNSIDKLDVSDWREFKVEDLFEAQTKTAKNNNYTKLKEPEGDYVIPALSSRTTNNSFGFYVRKEDHELIDKICLSVTSNGDAGRVFVQTNPFAIAQDAYALIMKNYKSNTEPYLFVATMLEKSLVDKYGYDNKATWNKVKTEQILLPAITNPETEEYEPDWDFMNKYMGGLNIKLYKRLLTTMSEQSL